MSHPENDIVKSGSSVLVASSQTAESSPVRARKRKHFFVSNGTVDSDAGSSATSGDYDLPSNEFGDQIVETTQQVENENTVNEGNELIRHQIHADAQRNVYVTQMTQPWSSPTRIRGPRWKKKTPSPPTSPSQLAYDMSSSPASETRNVGTGTTTDSNRTVVANGVDEYDDDELDALIADQNFESRLLESNDDDLSITRTNPAASKSYRQTTLFGMATVQQPSQILTTQARKHNWPLASRDEKPTHHDLRLDAMNTWIYPLNVGKIRDYQYNIVYKALFHNVLVALPTGLGKTFIAATVMLNWFNWTKNSQIVFMAPTKPLVSQQIDACFHVAGIPRSQTTLLTGEISVPIRAEEWQEKRVFFMTPQTFINDLQSGIADPKKIILVVVDEAHKASGSYAYVTVVQFLRRFNPSFRLLALTATPGSTVESVQKVIDSLGLARVEIRTEESLDIREFVHHRDIDLEIFDYSDEIQMCLESFRSFTQSILDKLCSQNAFWGKDPTALTLYGLMKARQQWSNSEAGRRAGHGLKGMMHACFTPLMSLAHNLELLKFHGIGPFYHKMVAFEAEASGKYAKGIIEHAKFQEMMKRIKMWINDDNFVGHPKLSYLNTVVLNHFMDAGDGLNRAGGRSPSDTRIMVFAHYRDSAEEITRVLNRHKPMVRAHIFVGQSGKKGREGMDQKTQIDIIKKFKAGTYNTIVATSIGEEGLDIGEVDLIVCYDCSKSPIRMLQRMGRTGRKRAGNIVMLLMRGKEERGYYSAKDNYSKIQQIIENGSEFNFRDDCSPRIVPKDISPVVDKRHVEIPLENTQGGTAEPRKRKAKPVKKPAKRFNMPDDVETGFRFLGGNKIRNPAKTQVTMTTNVDRSTADLPILQQVMLSTNEEFELEDKYAQVAGTEPQYIQVLSLGNRPDKLYRPDKTALVRHSKATAKLLAASKVIRGMNGTCRLPRDDEIIHEFPSEQQIPDENNRQRRQPKKRHVAHKRRTNTYRERPAGSEEDEYDSNDSFIDDGPLTSMVSSLKEGSSSPSRLIEPNGLNSTREGYHMVDDDDEDNDLPDMGDLIPASKVQQGIHSKTVQLCRKRRIISDDEDDDMDDNE